MLIDRVRQSGLDELAGALPAFHPVLFHRPCAVDKIEQYDFVGHTSGLKRGHAFFERFQPRSPDCLDNIRIAEAGSRASAPGGGAA